MSPSEIDAPTLARAQRGEERAVTALVAFYQDRIYAVVARLLVRRPESIDDVAQEAFMKILRHLARFTPGERARLSTWMITIATRTCIDLLRRRAPDEPEDVEALAAPDDLEGRTADRELGRRVELAMAKLPDEQRAVLVLRAYCDLDYPEIASALGVEEGTVKSRLSRARAGLRALLPGEVSSHG